MIEQQRQRQRQRRLLKCSTRGAYATFMLGISRIRRVHAKPLQGTRKLLSHSDVINYKRFAATKHIQPRNLSYNSQLKFSDFSALFCIINLHCARVCVCVCECVTVHAIPQVAHTNVCGALRCCGTTRVRTRSRLVQCQLLCKHTRRKRKPKLKIQNSNSNQNSQFKSKAKLKSASKIQSQTFG